MQILVLLGMYFDAVVIFVTSQTLLFRLALAILCDDSSAYSVGTLLSVSKVVSGLQGRDWDIVVLSS